MTEMFDIFSDECIFGLRCSSQRCGLFHPTGWNFRRNIPCPRKAECRVWACQHWHHRGHAPIDREKCPLGLLCPNSGCGLDHGIGWDWRKNTECDTISCYNKACIFMHTKGQKSCRCVECKKTKEPFNCVISEEEKSETHLRYCSQKCHDKFQARMKRRDELMRLNSARHYHDSDEDDDYERERMNYEDRRRGRRRGRHDFF